MFIFQTLLFLLQNKLVSGLIDSFSENQTNAFNVADSGKMLTLSTLLSNIFACCPSEKVVLVSHRTKVSICMKSYLTSFVLTIEYLFIGYEVYYKLNVLIHLSTKQNILCIDMHCFIFVFFK